MSCFSVRPRLQPGAGRSLVRRLTQLDHLDPMVDERLVAIYEVKEVRCVVLCLIGLEGGEGRDEVWDSDTAGCILYKRTIYPTLN